jgi:hypothetical protein
MGCAATIGETMWHRWVAVPATDTAEFERALKALRRMLNDYARPMPKWRPPHFQAFYFSFTSRRQLKPWAGVRRLGNSGRVALTFGGLYFSFMVGYIPIDLPGRGRQFVKDVKDAFVTKVKVMFNEI